LKRQRKVEYSVRIPEELDEVLEELCYVNFGGMFKAKVKSKTKIFTFACLYGLHHLGIIKLSPDEMKTIEMYVVGRELKK